MARDVEEAAADLGAKPFTVFCTITLPMMRPAIVAGWLLAFVLSLDDLVIASLPFWTAIQHQPEPNWPTPAAMKSSFILA